MKISKRSGCGKFTQMDSLLIWKETCFFTIPIFISRRTCVYIVPPLMIQSHGYRWKCLEERGRGEAVLGTLISRKLKSHGCVQCHIKFVLCDNGLSTFFQNFTPPLSPGSGMEPKRKRDKKKKGKTLPYITLPWTLTHHFNLAIFQNSATNSKLSPLPPEPAGFNYGHDATIDIPIDTSSGGRNFKVVKDMNQCFSFFFSMVK